MEITVKDSARTKIVTAKIFEATLTEVKKTTNKTGKTSFGVFFRKLANIIILF